MVNEILGDRVLLLATPKDEKTAGGIIVPDAIPTDTVECTVVQCADMCEYVAPTDVVLIPSHSGRKVTIKGVEYITLSEESIILIL
jgi:chaperonin GroES